MAERSVTLVDFNPPFEAAMKLVNRSRRQPSLDTGTGVGVAGRSSGGRVEPVLFTVRRIAKTGGDAAVADETFAVESASGGLERTVVEASAARGRFGVEDEVFVAVKDERSVWRRCRRKRV